MQLRAEIKIFKYDLPNLLIGLMSLMCDLRVYNVSTWGN